MPEATLELAIPVLLPGVETHDDGCLDRLESALQNHRGLQRAHLMCDKQPALLCLHYDPNVITLAQVQRLAEHTGAKIVERYHHEVIPIDGMQSSDSVGVIEQRIKRMDGLLAVSINYAAQVMRVEFDNDKTNLDAIKQQIRAM